MFQGHFDLETATPVETAIPDLLFERGLYWASGVPARQSRRSPQMVQSRSPEGTCGRGVDAPRGRRDDVGCRDCYRAAAKPAPDDRALPAPRLAAAVGASGVG